MSGFFVFCDILMHMYELWCDAPSRVTYLSGTSLEHLQISLMSLTLNLCSGVMSMLGFKVDFSFQNSMLTTNVTSGPLISLVIADVIFLKMI